MSYTTTAKRNKPGVYTLSFGKGRKKLTTVCREVNGRWVTDDRVVTCATRLKDAKQEWGRVAESKYYDATCPELGAGDDVPYETHEDRQRLIDEAPDYETALHRKQVFENMEDAVEHIHRLSGEAYRRRTYRPPIPPRQRKAG